MFEPDRVEIDRFKPDKVKLPELGFTYLRRGVIAVNEIGYI